MPVGVGISRVSYTVSLDIYFLENENEHTKRRSLAPCRMRALDFVVVVVVVILAVIGFFYNLKKK